MHNLYTFGWRSTLALFGITLVVAWSFEQVGVIIGWPLVVYGLTMLQLMLRADAPREWPVLAAFVMGFPLIAACSQLYQIIK